MNKTTIKRRNPKTIKTLREDRRSIEEHLDGTHDMVEVLIQESHDREANDSYLSEWAHDHHITPELY